MSAPDTAFYVVSSSAWFSAQSTAACVDCKQSGYGFTLCEPIFPDEVKVVVLTGRNAVGSDIVSILKWAKACELPLVARKIRPHLKYEEP